MSLADGALLQLDEIGVEFKGVKALRSVSIAVRPGEWLGVIGPNGSGKTTLMNAIMGVYRLAHGQIHFRGVDISSAGPLTSGRKGIVRSFQHDQLAGTLTLAENVALSIAEPDSSRGIHGWFGRERRTVALAREALAGVGCGGYADMLPREVPQGVRRLAGIARAITAEDARLLLLDEPAAGLSDAERGLLRGLLAQLRQTDPELAVILIEHDVRFIASETPRVVALDAGTMIGDGPTAAVLASAAVATAFLGKTLDAED